MESPSPELSKHNCMGCWAASGGPTGGEGVLQFCLQNTQLPAFSHRQDENELQQDSSRPNTGKNRLRSRRVQFPKKFVSQRLERKERGKKKRRKKGKKRQGKHLLDTSAIVHEAFCWADEQGNILECSTYWIIF